VNDIVLVKIHHRALRRQRKYADISIINETFDANNYKIQA